MRTIFLIFLLMVWGIPLAFSEIIDDGQRIEFWADHYERDLKTQTMLAVGNVRIKIDPDEIQANQVEIDLRSHLVRAQGNVRFTSGKDWLEAAKIEYNYATRRGKADQVNLKVGHVVIEAKEAEKIDPLTYSFKNAQYSPCLDCPPTWAIWASRVRVVQDGYAWVHHALFRIFNVPIFYIPFGVFPVKDKRQSGFLFPSYLYGEKYGHSVEIPFYWAISRSHDATFGLRFMTRRGWMEGFEYRYRLAEEIGGQWNLYLVQDHLFKKSHETPYRYGFYTTDQVVLWERKFRARFRGGAISDDKFVLDFKEIPGEREAALESKGLAAVAGDRSILNLEAAYFEKLLDLDPRATDRDTVHRLPAIRYSLLDVGFVNIPVRGFLDVGYTHYTNFGRGFIDFNNNHQYEVDGDQLLKVSRFSFRPTLMLPISLRQAGELMGSVTYDETLYLPEVIDSQVKERNFFEFNLSYALGFEKVKEKILGFDALKHSVRPFISYYFIPFVRRELEIPRFDEIDRFTTRNEFFYGIIQSVLTREGSRKNATYRELGEFAIYQTADLLQPERKQLGGGDLGYLDISRKIDKVFSDIIGDLQIYLRFVDVSMKGMYDIYENGIRLFSSALVFKEILKSSLSVNYVYNAKTLSHSLGAGIEIGFFKRLKAYFRNRYDFKTHRFLSTTFGGRFIPSAECWDVTAEFEKSTTTEGLQFMVQVRPIFFEPDFSSFRSSPFARLNPGLLSGQ